MAITINTQPSADTILSPYRPLELTAQSTATIAADPNLYTVKMRCYIYLDGSSTADNADNPIVLDPNLGSSYVFTFDISGYLAGLNTLTTTINSEDGAITLVDASSNSLKKVKVKFEEVLFNNSSRLLEDGAQSSFSNEVLVINGVWQHNEYVGSYGELNDYMMGGDDAGKFLTNYRESRVVGINDSEYLSGICLENGSQVLKVTLYGGINRSGSVDSYYRSIGGFPGDRFDIAVGPANINATTGFWENSAGTSIADPVIDSSVGSYTVQIVSSISFNADNRSERLVFNIDHKRNGKETRIKFLNRLGAFEYFSFKGYKDESTSVRNQYYNRALGSSYGLHEGGDRVLSSDVRKQFKVYSQPLKHNIRRWLEEMLDGHECYVLENGVYLPIKMRAGSTEIINDSNQLSTISFTYQLANPIRRQHGGY